VHRQLPLAGHYTLALELDELDDRPRHQHQAVGYVDEEPHLDTQPAAVFDRLGESSLEDFLVWSHFL